MEIKDRIILALDLPDEKSALKFLDPLQGLIKKVKIGPALFIKTGPLFVETLQKKGYDIFLDLKLHDIPNTVALGVNGAKSLGVWMLTLHISGGKEMLKQAKKTASGSPLLAGVTVLTSFQDNVLKETGITCTVRDQVKRLASLAKQVKLDAMVASPLEAKELRTLVGSEMLIITPGIRFDKSSPDDQARTMNAEEAIAAGADYLVIGRPILHAENPKAFLESIFSGTETPQKI